MLAPSSFFDGMIKVENTFKSCTTQEQLNSAQKYADLFRTMYAKFITDNEFVMLRRHYRNAWHLINKN